MKIPFIGSGPKIQGNRTETDKISKKPAENKASSGSESKANSQTDNISISSSAELLGKVADAAKANPEIRTELVQKIKKEVADGTYRINSEKIADKMMKEALSEIV